MSCTVTVDSSGLTSTPFGSGAPGGRVFGSLRLTAVCEDREAEAELQLDEDDDGLFASFIEWIGGPKTYNKPGVVGAAGNETGFVTIESVWRVSKETVGVQLNVTSDSGGTQTFDLDYKCRCNPPGGNWTKGAVTVSITL